MRISTGKNDATEFIVAVNQAVEGLLTQEAPPELIVVQIDSWFGPRWLAFAGKALGLMGVRDCGRLRIPPFVPNRVHSELRFVAPFYDRSEEHEPIHRKLAAKTAFSRLAREVAPGAMLLWYSGNTAMTARGCMMAYIPNGDGYRSWHTQWGRRGSWHTAHAHGMKVPEVLKLLNAEPISSTALR